MKILLKKKIISIILVISLTFTFLAIPTVATNINVTNAATYSIKIDNTLFNVTITPNTNGTKTITVVGGGNAISWSSAKLEKEDAVPMSDRVTGSYDSYRYIYCSTAAYVWHLDRPLQNDGSACSKGVMSDSSSCRSFAREVESMKASEERINKYLAEKNLALTEGAQLILAGAGSAAGFLVASTLIASTVAGIVAYIMTSYTIPSMWESAITILVETEYNNIRNAMINANYYFEKA
ncbi:MAG: hypothetical protein J6I50_01015 [Clostridia bacterium]|nr:hypothetical protein [Clostridia bacterium]